MNERNFYEVEWIEDGWRIRSVQADSAPAAAAIAVALTASLRAISRVIVYGPTTHTEPAHAAKGGEDER